LTIKIRDEESDLDGTAPRFNNIETVILRLHRDARYCGRCGVEIGQHDRISDLLSSRRSRLPKGRILSH